MSAESYWSDFTPQLKTTVFDFHRCTFLHTSLAFGFGRSVRDCCLSGYVGILGQSLQWKQEEEERTRTSNIRLSLIRIQIFLGIPRSLINRGFGISDRCFPLARVQKVLGVGRGFVDRVFGVLHGFLAFVGFCELERKGEVSFWFGCRRGMWTYGFGAIGSSLGGLGRLCARIRSSFTTRGQRIPRTMAMM
jgi:hypothetical protein